MFGIGLPELIVILAVALIVVGPDKLPELAKTIAKQLLELKSAANSFKDAIKDEADEKPFDTISPDDYLPEKLAAKSRELAEQKKHSLVQDDPSPDKEEDSLDENQVEKSEDEINPAKPAPLSDDQSG